ncbi:hypothetical protein VP01_620g4 [Puccinia sorghi]|uniref:GPI inositol-deacylase n=1 Tax=Puccinia sorghi TaxID=27349 RepID=A0A0L6UGK6_9BASI|nr:hypothetical protein VP01_620g4 [Puccinia sorghi]
MNNYQTTPSPLPVFSPPLSAALRAGTLTPGERYAPSPTVKRLKKILEQQQEQQSPLARLSLEKIRLINYQYALLFNKTRQRTRETSSSTTTSSLETASSSTAAKIKQWFWAQQQLTNTKATHPPKPISYHTTEPSSFAKPKFPLVLCHGLLGFDVLGPAALGLTYFRGVREALEERGVEVHVAKVPSCASIEERAKTLAEFIETRLPGRTVNLIGHSMGGLDSRFMITHLKPTSFKVASLTTIGTPHRGSAFADYLLLDVLGRECWLAALPNRQYIREEVCADASIAGQHLSTFLQISKSLGLPGGGQAFVELTSERMHLFNQSTADVDGVAYFSYGAACEPSFASPFRLPWGVVYEREGVTPIFISSSPFLFLRRLTLSLTTGPNDGLVSVASAQWGSYLGTLDNVNHAELVGWVEPWKTLTKKQIKHRIPSDEHQPHQQHSGQFKVVPFYLQVVDSLAKKGF